MEDTAFLQTCKKIWKKKGAAALSSRGASGGIGTLWDERKFEAIVIKNNTHWILTVLKHKESNSLVSIVNLYAPNSYSEKINCWNLLHEEQNNL